MSEAELSQELADRPGKTRSRITARKFMIGLALGLVAGLALILLGLRLTARDTTPQLTPQALADAEKTWQQHGPSSYDLDLLLTGTQPGRVHIEVRNGVVTNMLRDGRAPNQRRTWDYWTVPNQFGTIAQDLESAQSPARPFGVSSPSQVQLRADFDTKYGYPAYYQRTVLGGTNQVEWRITRFSALP